MKPFRFIMMTCSIFIFGQCMHEDEHTEAMNAYLHEKFNLRPQDSLVYCFFPNNQCKNCFLYNARHLSPALNRHLVVITGFDSTNFAGFETVYKDQEDAMMALPVLDYGNRIVTFEKGEIKNAVPVTNLYAQLDSTWKTMSYHK